MGAALHIPENYLSPSTCGALALAMVPVWSHAVREVRRTVPREKVPLLGVAAAFSFLAMMFNVPIPGGTTGHAVCGTLVAILFGPWAATLAVSIALAIQALLFGDGGVLSLGANCFNMAFVLPMVGYWLYSAVSRRVGGTRGELVGAAVGSYAGINAAALCAGVEFGIQPILFTDSAGQALYCPYPIAVSVPAMLLGHLTVWGLAEAGFTTGILAFVRRTDPSFGVAGRGGSARPSAPVVGLVAVLVALTPLGLLAGGDAWGEWSVEDVSRLVGYTPGGMADGWEWSALLPDYSVAGLPDAVGYVVSAVIGVSLLVILFRLVAAAMRPGADFA